MNEADPVSILVVMLLAYHAQGFWIDPSRVVISRFYRVWGISPGCISPGCVSLNLDY